MVKQLLLVTRVPGHVQPVGWPCGAWMYCGFMALCYGGCEEYGAANGYHSLEWNWPKDAMNRPMGAGLVAGAKVFFFS